MADLKKIAKAYGMSVNDLANAVGYSRQNLYQVLNSEHAVGTSRMYAALKLLKYESDNLYQKELKQAEENKAEREKAIIEISRTCGLVIRGIDAIEQIE